MHRRNIFKRIFRIYSIVSSILFVASIVLIYFLIKDNKRSSFVDKGITINEVIDKNFVEGFQNTNSDGVFSFSLSEEDINTFLNESYKTLNSKNIKSFYYENKDDHHYFCFDIKTVVFKSRLIIDTLASLNESDYSISLKIMSAKVGKFDLTKTLQKKGFLSKDNLDALFINASLPIRYVESTNSLIVKPLEFVSLFPKSHVSENIFNYCLANSSNFVRLSTSNLGFKLDLTSLHKLDRSSNYIVSPKVDIKNELKQFLLDINVEDMSFFETRVAYKLDAYKLSDIVNENKPSEFSDSFTSLLTSNRAAFDVIVETSFISSDTVLFNVFYDLNGYYLNESISASFLQVENSNYYCFSFELDSPVNQYKSMYDNDLSIFLSHMDSDMFIFNPLNKMIEVNLKSMNDELPAGKLKSSIKSVSFDNETNCLDFSITKV